MDYRHGNSMENMSSTITAGLGPEIKAIIFDLDDTLLVEEDSARDCLIRTCHNARDRYGLDPVELHDTLRRSCRNHWFNNSPAREYCVRVGISSWEGLWATYEGDNPHLEALKAWAPQYRQNSWHDALLEHHIDDPSLADDLAQTFIQLRRAKHVLFDDALPVLEQFQGQYPLALLTNGAPDLQRLKIEKSQLESFFDRIVISGEEDLGKPDPAIFRRTADRLGSEPQHTLMIGNSIKSDIQGAQAAGLIPVWLNRNGERADSDPPSTTEINTLAQIPALLST